jgi:hypothetical protein
MNVARVISPICAYTVLVLATPVTAGAAVTVSYLPVPPTCTTVNVQAPNPGVPRPQLGANGDDSWMHLQPVYPPVLVSRGEDPNDYTARFFSMDPPPAPQTTDGIRAPKVALALPPSLGDKNLLVVYTCSNPG